METVVVRKRKQKEQEILDIFEALFKQIKEPISANLFKEKAYDEYKDIYSKHMIHAVIKSLNKQKLIQQVFKKEETSTCYLFVPLEIDIPYEERDWETMDEKRQIQRWILESLPDITKEEYELFMEMVKYRDGNRKIQMPLYRAMRENGEEYKKFIKIIKPYLPYISRRESIIIQKKLGMNGEERLSFEKAGKLLNVGYSQSMQLFSSGLYQILKVIKEKYKMMKNT